ncbi:nSTAND1 domain-containing NTPase [Paraburkholderia sp. RL17-337-BIB-A]|uniref:nSTAND1 domain-containing NTPase n=1 Tax=Paraburkholderia sp. RL17-337-BIB-A TaxID=3031636 RepID=UPI0038B74AD1
MTILYERGTPTSAGTHILVVGVGRYPYLIDGTPGLLADYPLGLGQLSSPPVSAKAFIDWCFAPLFDPAAAGFENPDSPLLSLEGLASSEAPVVVDTPTGSAELGLATRSNIQTAFARWRSHVISNDANIGVFYFCGHGVMVNSHYLLAEDFGQNADDPWGGAIDISRTIRGVMRAAKGSLYFFIDACRQISRDMNSIEGGEPRALLSFVKRDPVIANAVSLIEATGEGKLAFSLEKGKTSRFSEALLVALSGNCGVHHRDSGTWDVDSVTLASTVRRLLEEGNKATAYRQFCRPEIEGASVPLLRLRVKPRLAMELPLTIPEIRNGLERLEHLLLERAPMMTERFAELAHSIKETMEVDLEAQTSIARHRHEQALARVDELCERAVEITFHALAQGGVPPPYDSRPPFKGLSPFQEDDKDFFFGREKLVEKLLERLDADNFLPLLGPSGCGKSSLALAGIASRLSEQHSALRVITFTPGSTPASQLEAQEKGLDAGPVLYIVDQFEEVFTLCREEKQRNDFIDAILLRANQNRVVISMRADFWGECAPYHVLKERMQARQELIAPMTAVELRHAIELQAAKVGLRFEPELSNTIVDEVAGEPGAMPILQYTLSMLWERRCGCWLKADEYRMLGGVKGSIAATAERLYEELSATDQTRVRDIFLRLTRLDEDARIAEEQRDTRRRLSYSELVPQGVAPEVIRNLVNRFIVARLLVTSFNSVTNENEVEVCHEALIRHWNKLRSWLDEDRALLRIRADLGEAARDWQKDPHDDSRLVHRGVRLQAAEELRTERQLPLTGAEIEYIDACIADSQRLELLKASRVLGKAYETALEAMELTDPIDTARSLALAVASYQAYSTVTAYRAMWERRTYPPALAIIDIDLDSLERFACSGDGRYVAAANDKRVRCWSTQSVREEVLVQTKEPVLHLAFSPTSQWLVAVTKHNLLWICLSTGIVRQAKLDEKCYPVLEERRVGDGLAALIENMQRELPKFVVTPKGLVILQTVTGLIGWRLPLDGVSEATLVVCDERASQFCTCLSGDHLVVIEKDHLIWCAPGQPPTRREVLVEEAGALSCAGNFMYTSKDGSLRVFDLVTEKMLFQGERTPTEGTHAVLFHVDVSRFVIVSPTGFEIVCCKTGSRDVVACDIAMPHDSPSSSDDESHVLVRAEPNKVVIVNLLEKAITTIVSESAISMSKLSPSGECVALVNRSGVHVYLTSSGLKFGYFAIRASSDRGFIFTKDLGFYEQEASIFHLAEVDGHLRFDSREIPDILHFEDHAGYLMGLRGPMLGMPQKPYRITWAELSPNGSALAMLISQRPTGGTLVVRIPDSGNHFTFSDLQPLSAARWLTDHEMIWAFENDEILYLFDMVKRSLTKLAEVNTNSTVYRIASRAASRSVASISVDDAENVVCHMFSLSHPQPLFSSTIGQLDGAAHSLMDVVRDVSLSATGRYIGICTAAGKLLLLDAEFGEVVYRNNGAGAYCICFSNDDEWCSFASDLGGVKLLEISTGEMIQSFSVGKVQPEKFLLFRSLKGRAAIRISDDKSVLMTALSDDSCIRYWSIPDAREIGQIRHVKNDLNIVCVSEDVRTIAILESSAPIESKLTIGVFKSSWPSNVVAAASSASRRPPVLVSHPPDYSDGEW